MRLGFVAEKKNRTEPHGFVRLKIIILERKSSGVVAKDINGNVLYSSVRDTSGGVSIYDDDMRRVNYYPPEEVLAARNEMMSQ